MSSISCVVIGEGNVALSCLHHLLTKGFQVKAVFTNTKHLSQFSEQCSIRVFPRGANIGECVQSGDFDYLFSRPINNPRILTSSILSLPRCLSINYHDSPLPAYAGVNATSWAIINGETEHGVSWHIVEAGIDTGDILQFESVPISDDDSALSLNMNCLDACLDAFERLADDILNYTLRPRKQNISKRSYYGLNDVAPNLGVLSPHDDAISTYNLARALEYGNHDNLLGSPKILTESGHCFLVTSAEIAPRRRSGGSDQLESEILAGTVLEVVDDTLLVATPSDDLLLSVAQLDGRHLTFGKRTDHGLVRGARLSSITGLDYEATQNIRRKEPFWRRKMKEYEPTIFSTQKLHVVSSILDHGERYLLKRVSIAIPELLMSNTLFSDKKLLTASFIAFLGRACCTPDIHVGLLANKSSITPQYRPFYSDICPGVFCLDFSAPVWDALDACIKVLIRHEESKTFLLDMFYRYPELRGIKRKPHHNVVIGFENENHEDSSLCGNILADANILVLLSKHEMEIVYEDKPGNSYNLVVEVVKYFPTFLKSLEVLNATSTLLDVNMISPEVSQLYQMPQKSSGKDGGDLLDNFISCCQCQPTHLAVTSSHVELTYKQLQEEISKLSSRITESLPMDYRGEKRCLALHLPNSVAYVVSVLATASIGCPFIPLPVDLPSDRLAFMLQDAGVTVMLTNSSIFQNQHLRQILTSSRMLFEESTVYGDLVMVQFCIAAAESTSSETSENLSGVYSFTNLVDLDTTEEEHETKLDSDCCYLMYTSGSTGKPKGVQVKRSGVLNMATAQIQAWELGPSDVIAQFASIGFDATISEIFTPFLSGACLALLQDTERLGKELAQVMSSLKVTVVTLPPSVLNIYGPKDFPPLKKVITAGEACTLHLAGKWTNEPGVRFFNAYGPTETTVCATIYEYSPSVDFDTATQDLPIGKAIDGVQVYLFDDFMKMVPPGIIGEIYIGGSGVSAGYIGHAQVKNQEKFVQNPLDNRSLLYRTGDHAVQSPDGNLTYVGRLDDQVKIRGQRVDLSEIEQIIRQHTKVDMAVVIKHQGSRASDACIAAFVAPTFVYTSELREYLSKTLPKYMMPTYIKKMNVDDFPVTLNGKVDRKALRRDESVYEYNTSVGNSHLSHSQLVVAKLWCKVLQLDQDYAYNLHRLSAFTDLGGNSLHMVLLQREIEDEFNLVLSFTEIGAASTIEDFADIIKRKKDLLKAPEANTKKNAVNLKELITKDAEVDFDSLNVENEEGSTEDDVKPFAPKNILLSGATGFLGAFLLQQIMEQSDAHVCCMVRESSEVRGFSRITSNMRKYDLWKTEYGSRIAIVLSDLSQPEMGIAPDIYRELCTAIDTIFMNAAQMNFNKDYHDHRQANVLGTKEFIKFAFTGRKKYLFTTSSLAVFLFPPKKDKVPKTQLNERTRHESYRSLGLIEKENLGQKLSLNSRQISSRSGSREMLIDFINTSLRQNGTHEGYLDIHSHDTESANITDGPKNRSSSFSQFFKMSTLNNRDENKNNSSSQIFGNENNANNAKASLRQAKSVDINLTQTLRIGSPKVSKKLEIADDITEEDTGKDHNTSYQRVVNTEDDNLEDPTRIAGGYGQSKWASEQLVLQALEYLPGGAVFRPARISGHSTTGVGPTNDLFACTLMGMEKLGAIPDMDFPYDLTPVDFCAKGMIEIMLQIFQDDKDEMPQMFHFFNKSTIPFAELFDGIPVEKLPLDQWRQKMRNADRDNPLIPLIPFLNSDFWDKSPYWPVFSTKNTDKCISQECKKLMPHTRELLKVYRNFFNMKCSKA